MQNWYVTCAHLFIYRSQNGNNRYDNDATVDNRHSIWFWIVNCWTLPAVLSQLLGVWICHDYGVSFNGRSSAIHTGPSSAVDRRGHDEDWGRAEFATRHTHDEADGIRKSKTNGKQKYCYLFYFFVFCLRVLPSVYARCCCCRCR